MILFALFATFVAVSCIVCSDVGSPHISRLPELPLVSRICLFLLGLIPAVMSVQLISADTPPGLVEWSTVMMCLLGALLTLGIVGLIQEANRK